MLYYICNRTYIYYMHIIYDMISIYNILYMNSSNIILEILHSLAVFSWRFHSVDKYESDGTRIKLNTK